MALVVSMRWPGVTPDQYDAVRQLVRFEEEPAEGGVFHVAWFENGDLQVLDVWRSRQDFERFVHERLMPAARDELGLEGEPDVKFGDVYAHFVAPTAVGA